ncbi:hypothetical protein [Arthrobacter sp. H5]|uniref:hypothetical protein n=1 Tax=Arthrobacter sp. H5 TaxID=1267973 RepID=UPI000488B41C|nr:hypothetical protein [Arthrobacter sp. H5]
MIQVTEEGEWVNYFIPLEEVEKLSRQQRDALSYHGGDWNAEHRPPNMPRRYPPNITKGSGWSLTVLVTEASAAASRIHAALSVRGKGVA